MLTDLHIERVKSTIGVLEAAGPELTAYFYQRMFSHHPELKNIFNMSNQHSGRQQVALFEAIAAYAKNIDNVAVLTQAVERIAQKHSSFFIQAEHYAIVGHHLIATLRELAAEVFTAELEEAWTLAYQFLAQIFIDREAELYQQRASLAGGWLGARRFCLVAKQVESALVTSFTLVPIDEQAVLSYQPGQYLGIEVMPSGSDYKEIRQYSLSDAANGDSYRISVKRESAEIPGLVSNYLHDQFSVGDELMVYPPAGEFFWQDRQAPVVLISAGVGLTPMQAMLETLDQQNYSFPVYYLHACESAEQHSFAARSQALIDQHGWQQATWYKKIDNLSAVGFQGLMDVNAVLLPVAQGDFYLCGPVVFMQFVKQQLMALGVAENRLHYEVFGPHASL